MAKYYFAAALLLLLNPPNYSSLGASQQQHFNSSSAFCHAFAPSLTFHTIKQSHQYNIPNTIQLSQVPIRKSGVIGLKDDHSPNSNDGREKNDIRVINSSNGEKISVITPKQQSAAAAADCNDGQSLRRNGKMRQEHNGALLWTSPRCKLKCTSILHVAAPANAAALNAQAAVVVGCSKGLVVAQVGGGGKISVFGPLERP